MRWAVTRLLPSLHREGMRLFKNSSHEMSALFYSALKPVELGNSRMFNKFTNRLPISTSITCRNSGVSGPFSDLLVPNKARRFAEVGIFRSFHSSKSLQSDEKNPEGSRDPQESPDDQNEKNESPEKGQDEMLVPRRKRRSSGSSEVELVKRDPKWIPNEVLVIPVYRWENPLIKPVAVSSLLRL